MIIRRIMIVLSLTIELFFPFSVEAESTMDETRNHQSKRTWTAHPSYVVLKVGELQQITILLPRGKIPYTPVWGWDNPVIGILTARGLFRALLPGDGLITVNLGNHRQQIYIKVVE